MRLIDADALIEDVRKNSVSYFADDFAREWVDKQPTIEERKTGRWIDAVIQNENGGLPVQICDQCNTFFPLAYTGGGHRFCPNCGAKMEGEG